MAYITTHLSDYFSEESIRMLGFMEWDSYEFLENPNRIRLSSIEDNETEIPWYGERIEVQDIPPQAYFCTCRQLSDGLASLVDYSGRFATIRCINGYDWSWCGPGLVFRGTESILADVVKRLCDEGINAVCYPIDKAWYIQERNINRKQNMEKSIRKELSEAIFKAIEITMLRWDEVQEDENCAQAAEVLQMLHSSLEEDE